MRNPSANSGSTAGLRVLVLLLAIFSGCVSVPKKSVVMTKIQGLDLTAEQLRMQVADFVVVFGGMVERGADEVIENSDSPKAKENALLWKANAIPVCQMAAFQFDPMVGLLDLWAFSSQMTQFFENGKGSHLFGKEQHVAIRTARDFEAEVARFVEKLGPSINLEKAKTFIQEWVRNNPFQNILFTRRSTSMSLAALDKDKGLSEVLGGMDERMTDMTTRMNIMMQQMPKIGRWQGELFLADQAHRPVVSLFNSKQLEPAMKSFEKISDLAPKLPEFIETPRVAMTQDIRALTQKMLEDIRAKTQEALDETEEKSRALVDYMFMRALVLMGAFGGIVIVGAIILRGRPKVVRAG